ncbi:hypothetical protein BX616_006316 [Lobosporangium transversale]|uniref:Uncharacterized protein n=1 Tax=Lobosporangium transversale TaxID=64571 RepID=A0A1Y2G761_9FUNG|nr:hypothetical protein BCR41DRAFT_390439 [Lobosporangium transversale]KAF9915365.1 hypothetical protein BX616_006316 [Lobosporangium transversale]ORY99604.1 hypothetical protein BCR41DRAFT_390439 [Lobosporangium transversale]|eukprot:XP_021875899.1 hypothetical protein BCR41DRAFT_390439 [Lobosporangium transversale]
MQSDHAYQLPVSNIAYHVYNPEEDGTRTQAVSQQAFKRTMDNYHEHERLADLFQVELDKREREAQERKEREKPAKMQKKSSKRSHQSQGQDRPQHPLPERHSLRRHLRNLSNNPSNSSLLEGNGPNSKDSAAILVNKSSGNHRRSRRNSDISTSDISGYGDDDVRILPPLSKSTHLQSSSSSHVNRDIHLATPLNEQRSLSSSPALPLTPSPRLTPMYSGHEERNGTDSGTDIPQQSSNHLINNSSFSSLASSTSSTSSPLVSSALSLPGHMVPGRKKRKQAIPVHPSVVDRIPGITLRIQREKQSDQLQVEILKNLDDYTIRRDADHSPELKLQATQDLRKVRESIESGRPGYAFFPAPSSVAQSQHLNSTEVSESVTVSAGFSVDALVNMTDMFDARSLPLSWENFSTRECVVNKVIGKHDKDLDVLEEAVQDAIARQHYTHQQTTQSQHERERDHEGSPVSNTIQKRNPSVPVNSSTIAALSTSPSATMTAGPRTTKPAVTVSPAAGRPAPTRATRSRMHVSDRGGKDDLIAHDDIEFVLKQKRKKKLEERRRLGSKASSKDEDDEDDERRAQMEDERGEYGDDETMVIPPRENIEGRSKMDIVQGVYSDEDHDRKRARVEHTKLKQEDADGDVSMAHHGKVRGQQRNTSMESNTSSTRFSAQDALSGQRRASDEDNSAGTSSSSEEDDDEDEDYHDTHYKPKGPLSSLSQNASRRRRTLSESKASVPHSTKKAVDTIITSKGPTEKSKKASDVTAMSPSLLKRSMDTKPTALMPTEAQSAKNRGDIERSRSNRSRSPISTSGMINEGIRRNKKIWSRGRNSRKEDEVVDTTSDDDEDRALENGIVDVGDIDSDAMPLTRHVRSDSTASSSLNVSDIITNRNETQPEVRKVSAAISTPAASLSSPNTDLRDSSSTNNSNVNGKQTQESGGRTRARARSFSTTIETADKTKFFESALDVIEQKRRESLAKKKAARAEAEERERQEREERERRQKEEREELERQKAVARLQEQGKAQKIESTNLPKSSKSLPGRVLRRTKADASADEGSVDPDCTSCRLELSAEDKALWKSAVDAGEIRLPKTWGTHAILCTTCRLQYLEHHFRCTACFYVPVKEEMVASGSSCSRCKAGTWLMEVVRTPFVAEKRDARRKTMSDASS